MNQDDQILKHHQLNELNYGHYISKNQYQTVQYIFPQNNSIRLYHIYCYSCNLFCDKEF